MMSSLNLSTPVSGTMNFPGLELTENGAETLSAYTVLAPEMGGVFFNEEAGLQTGTGEVVTDSQGTVVEDPRSQEPMDISEVLDRNMPISDVALDTHSLGSDNEFSVDTLNELVSEAEKEVRTDMVLMESMPGTSVGSSIGTEQVPSVDSGSTSDLVSPAVTGLSTSAALPMSSEILRRRNDGALVKVTSTSLIQRPSIQVVEQPVVVSVNVADEYTVIDIPTEHLQPLIRTTEQNIQYHKCPNCNLLTTTEPLLKEHLLNSHQIQVQQTQAVTKSTAPKPSKQFKCDFEGCSWSFDAKYRLVRHRRTHNFDKPTLHKCEACGKSFTTKYNLSQHLKIVHDESGPKIECVVQGCGRKFRFKKQLTDHVRKVHPDIDKWICAICGAKKLTKEDFDEHVSRHERLFKCTICEKTYAFESRFREHMHLHEGIRPHKCQFKGCEWSFTTASHLRRHEKIHTDFRPFKCHYENCVRAYYRKEHLRVHIDNEHLQLKPFSCPIENCRSKFSSKSGLDAHLSKHYNQGSKKVFNCPIESCSRQCATEGALRCHIQQHLNRGDPGFLKILEGRDEILEETIVGLRLAAMNQIPGRPSTMLPVILSTLQTSVFGIEQPYKFLIRAAEEAAVKVQVNALEPPKSWKTTGDNIPSDSDSEDIETVNPSDVVEVELDPELQCEPSTSSFEVEKDTSGKLQMDVLYADVEVGCARTDYITNHLCSEHARTRRRIMKEEGNLIGVVSLQDLARVRNGGKDTELTDNDDEKTDSGNDSDGFEGFNLSELLRPPPDMTLKDPETGVRYDQTQLLQDDPPIPMVE